MIQFRDFTSENDYQILREISKHNCMHTEAYAPRFHIGNLDFDRFAFGLDLFKMIKFVLLENREIGFIAIHSDGFLFDLIIEEKKWTSDVLQYIESHSYNQSKILETEANSNDLILCRSLEENGYVKQESYRYKGLCDLTKIKEQPPLADGYTIDISTYDDIDRRVELFGIATGGFETTAELYRNMMNSPSYQDALDLVVKTGENEIIAYCTIWNDPFSKTSVLEPVACVEEHRRKGIMKSTLLYGMNLLKEKGTKKMYVGTSGSNLISQALYSSVGFISFGKEHEWVKIIKE